jgi:O-antigen ligase
MGNTNKQFQVDQILKKEAHKKIDQKLVWILVLALSLLPLLTRAAVFPFYSPVISGSVLDSGIRSDVFTYYKFVWLCVIAAIVLVIFLYKMLGKGYEIPASYINVPLGIMFLFILLSGVFAEYKSVALFGQYNRHEGTLTYLGYLVLFFVSANLTLNERQTNYILAALYPFLFVNVFLSLAHFYGYNILQNAFFKGLLFPASLQNSFNADAYVSSTLNNPNYVSGMAGVLTLLFLTKASLGSDRKQGIKDFVCAVAAFAMLLSSLSTSGFVTFVLLLPVVLLFILYSYNRKKGLLTGAGALAVFAVVFAMMNSHNPNVWNESVGFFFGSAKEGAQSRWNAEEAADWKQFAEQHSPFTAEVAHAEENQSVDDEFNLPPQGWAAGTGRTYIWSKTLDLIKERPIFGYGLDTLAYFFPQDDPMKNAGLNNPDTIVDKPHNMYIGIAFGAGILTLLAFLVLLFRHAWQHIALLKKRIRTERQVILASLFAGWCAYLVQALFNDSVIGTGVVFWTLFGISVSLLWQELAEQK